jgi:hypothetical protein
MIGIFSSRLSKAGCVFELAMNLPPYTLSHIATVSPTCFEASSMGIIVCPIKKKKQVRNQL